MRPVRGSRNIPARAASGVSKGGPRKAGRAKPPSVAPHRAPRRRIAQEQPGRFAALAGFFGRRLSLRRPMVWLTASLIVLVLIAGLLAGGYIRAAWKKTDAATAALSDYAGFAISKLTLSGENRTSPQLILAVLNLQPGQSIFSANLAEARARLLMLPWVAEARVTRRYPDSISVDIVEKQPFALWQSAKGLFVIERSGAPIVAASVKDFPKLPVFIGDAPAGGGELVAAIAGHRAIKARITAMQRVAQRRWNLILDDGVVVKLPETGWQKQLDVLDHLIVDQGILERDVEEIDLRSPDQFFFTLRGHKQAQPADRGSKI